jgi:MFS transporter, DHA2 family, multidrug resistance protein
VTGFFGTGPFAALGTDLVVGSAPPEKAGSASSLAATAGELGIALGVAALGSVGTAVYRDQISATIPATVPPQAAEAARDTLASAAAAAEKLPAGLSAELLEPAREAFTIGLTTVAGISALVVAALAITAVAALRQPPPSHETTQQPASTDLV